MIRAGAQVEIWDSEAWDAYPAQEQVFADTARGVIPASSQFGSGPPWSTLNKRKLNILDIADRKQVSSRHR